MLKRFAFSILSAAMVLSLGTGAAFASQGDRVSTAKAPLAGNIQPQSANLYVSWQQKSGAHHYQLTIRNTSTNNILYVRGERIEHKWVYGDSISLPEVPSGPYRVWLGAYDNYGNLIGQDTQYVTVNYNGGNVWLNPQNP
ncbi:hypothetical protein GPJ61_08270 [Brevibacillus formosus]|uniref:hypothetical protein n=1 Tax=Brevibacillus formosus TaxID=54913 RepID=UPI001CA59DA1|nr:hypothetical protein [Brevibacillus formosus]MBW5467851.1 hypothetical protein [Brevibacillus formosus]